jgi:hypothetical protein
MANIVLSLLYPVLAKPLKESIEKAMDCDVRIPDRYENSAEYALAVDADLLLMQAEAREPHNLDYCLAVLAEVRKEKPACKFALLCSPAEGSLAELAVQAKRKGQIDAFIFTDCSTDFLSATLKSML